ncbi:MAG: DHHW family protein [Bacteroidia bacterium]|jgi:hypothetical protein|nr:DHHW family protein [Bacteroidia bacterium]
MKKHKQIRKRLAWINFVLFGAVLTVGGVLFFVLPKIQSSAVENRRLTPFPRFSMHSFFEGHYTDSLDQYVADHFAFREALVSTSFQLAEWRGIPNREVKFYDASQLAKNKPGAITTNATLPDSLAAADTATVNENGDIIANMVVHNGMAIQYFGGNATMAARYAQAINKFRTVLPASVRIYDVVVPSHYDLYMPDEFRRSSNSEKKNIDIIYSNLNPGIIAVDAWTPMMAHKNEYLFFRTDHHWTGAGAYYAYAATVERAGMQPLALGQMQTRVQKNWLGSLYALTRDERLKEKPDTAVCYMIPNSYKAWRYTDENITKPIPAALYHKGGGYGMYLGGDFPLMKVETSNRSGRSVVILKNSYGNAFAPYFAAHFDKVYIIDYRYFNHSLPDFVKENGITDVVFINGSFSANTSWHIMRIEKLLKGAPPQNNSDSLPGIDSALIRKDSLLTDTLKRTP